MYSSVGSCNLGHGGFGPTDYITCCFETDGAQSFSIGNTNYRWYVVLINMDTDKSNSPEEVHQRHVQESTSHMTRSSSSHFTSLVPRLSFYLGERFCAFVLPF